MLDDSLADTQQFNAELSREQQFNYERMLSLTLATRYPDATPSPPLVSFTPNPAQYRFLRLHSRKNVTRWQWHFKETILRAHADNGDVATVSAGDLEEMILAGVMAPGTGCADVSITMAGMEMCV